MLNPYPFKIHWFSTRDFINVYFVWGSHTIKHLYQDERKATIMIVSKLYRDTVSFKSEKLFRFGHTESFIWIGISITAALVHILVLIYSNDWWLHIFELMSFVSYDVSYDEFIEALQYSNAVFEVSETKVL